MLKHAYLIMAHNEFEVLEKLLECLDDVRNDIFIHFDLKLTNPPVVETKYAGLFLLNDRVDVRWGDVSVIAAEYKLFEAASNRQQYSYYHLLSGVDLPLKSQDELHDFFDKHHGREFIGYTRGVREKEIDRKIRRIHLFAKSFRTKFSLSSMLKRIIRAGALRLQFLFAIQRNQYILFKKGPQWVSVTDEFVRYIMPKKTEVLLTYHRTYCGDEVFLQTICWNSYFQLRLFNKIDERKGSQRAIGWKDGELIDWEMSDYEDLIGSNCLFARKFSAKNKALVERITHHVKANFSKTS